MANHASGPLTITNGPLVVGGVTISTTEIGYVDGITPGTAAVDKAVVLTTGKVIDTIDITTLKVGGTTITATGAELNFTDVTAGTATASKAVVLDSSSKIDTIDMTAFKVGGTSVTATAAQLNFVAAVTAGTSAASKAVVLDASSKIDTIDLTAFKIGGTSVGSTAAELNSRTDDSDMTDTRTGAGAISVDKAYTALVTTAADALTLAAPTKPAFIKVIKMTTDGGDGTLASTNIVGQSAGTTSITFNDVDDSLVLVSDTVSGKWIVLKENGVTAA